MTGARKNKIRSGTKIRGRGRPREFDADTALKAATDTFLRKGYAAATLDDLSSAMAINRPSLYAAFKDKENLYQLSLRLYAERMKALFAEALSEKSFSKAMRQLYRVAIDAYFEDSGAPVGCFVACTAITEAMNNEAVRGETKFIMDGIDHLVAKRVEQAIADGDLPQSILPKALSRLAVGVLHSLALRARAGTSRKILDDMAADAVVLLSPRAH